MSLDNFRLIHDKEAEIKHNLEVISENRKKEFNNLNDYRKQKLGEIKNKLGSKKTTIQEAKEKEISKLIEDLASHTVNELKKYEKIEQSLIQDAKAFIEKHLFE